MLKEIAKKILPGITVVSSVRYGNKTLTRHDIRLPNMLAKLVREKNPIIFDVGAHLGESIEFYLKWFPQAELVSFEPNPKLNYQLKQTYPANKIFPVALSSQNGKVLFHELEHTLLSSIEEPNLESSYFKKLNEHCTSYEVECMTGDQFCRNEKICNIDILKMNVQGHEVDVLIGFQELLKENRISVIITEIDMGERYQRRVRFRDIENVICPYGYELYDITLIKRSPMHERIQFVNAVYVNQKLSEATLAYYN